MTATISGHDAITSSRDPRLRTATVPGTRVKLTTHRDCLPLFVDVAKRCNGDVKPLTWATWSYAYRAPRAGSGVSDHAGYAIDMWSNDIGRTGFPTKMTAEQARAMSTVLGRYRLMDGRYVFGWGTSDRNPGVTYSGPTYHRLSDPMHVFVAPGITMADCRTMSRLLHLAQDGTWLGAA